jgi:thymidylate synthase
MMHKTECVRGLFRSKLLNEVFTIDKTGQKTIEWIGASFIADEPSIFGTPSQSYIEKELRWYKSQITNVNAIGDKVPEAWKYAANDYGEINSNYGQIIFSDKYYHQYGRVLDELLANPDGRRATMIYNRPSIWEEYNENGKSDFICTNAVTYYIRDDKLHCVVQMRSNDVVYGYKNDYAWQLTILEELVEDYNQCKKETIEPITYGDIIWQVQNLHVYERHFHLVK